MRKIKCTAIIMLLLIFGNPCSLSARSFRGADRIQTPVVEDAGQKGPAVEADVLAQLPPFEERIVHKMVHELAFRWNNGTLSEHLDPGFYNKERLLDTIAESVPEDAVLRITSVRNIRQLDQTVRKEADTVQRTIRVSATVETQIEFDDPLTGFQRLPGTSEFIFMVTETYRAGNVQ